MLIEIAGVRQISGEGTRRWFRDDELDLIVWYREDGSIDGFQLCYGKLNRERALTFREPHSYQHHAIDDGEGPPLGPKMSPILVADGLVDIKRIEKLFSDRAANVPEDLADYVSDNILNYPGN